MALAEVRVHVKLESLTTAYSSITDNATGIIYFSSGEIAFPEDVWDDFPVIIVGWWLNALADYKQGFRDTVELNFMDGPFLVRLSHINNTTTQVEMIQEATDGNKVQFSIIADLPMLYRSIDNAAGILIEFCKNQQNDNPDYSELIKARQCAYDAFRN